MEKITYSEYYEVSSPVVEPNNAVSLSLEGATKF